MGCVCDAGYEGYDCSKRVCPHGRDPTSPTIGTDVEEKFVLECKASAGYFSLTALGTLITYSSSLISLSGHTTQPIPYDASPGLLKHLLESLPGVGSVRVAMSADPITALPSVCQESVIATTHIWFLNFLGQRPPIRVRYGTTSNTLMWPSGAQQLSHSTEFPKLRMVTEHTLNCPVCPLCTGSVYFTYKDSVSTPVDVTSSNAISEIRAAILSLTDLTLSGFGITKSEHIGASESSGINTLCDDTASTTWTISLRSDYGNIPFLGILDGTIYSGTSDVAANVTFSSNAGSGELHECSNQGTCDRSTGTCKCHDLFASGEIQYRAISSDGNGNRGSRGDCGFVEVTNAVCQDVGRSGCNGHGFCHAIGANCVCDEGWAGLDCRSTTCPQGRAWFDEAISSTEAHQLEECSNNGICDRSTGRCLCRDGFSGAACQYFDCPYDSDGPCSGKGWCVNMNKWAAMAGFEYGDESNLREYPDTWDAFTFYHCMCSARTPDGFRGNTRYPTVGPRAMISGRPAESPNLYGWRGWDCSERNCPTGDTITSPSSGPVDEIQRVICNGTSGDSFSLSLFGLTSLIIDDAASATEIKEAIEYTAAIGNVSVTFPNEEVDAIITACDPAVNVTDGGFLVRFTTEFGDLDMMTPSDTSIVVVEEYRKGTKVIINWQTGITLASGERRVWWLKKGGLQS